jgi:hypothetical protein
MAKDALSGALRRALMMPRHFLARPLELELDDIRPRASGGQFCVVRDYF